MVCNCLEGLNKVWKKKVLMRLSKQHFTKIYSCISECEYFCPGENKFKLNI